MHQGPGRGTIPDQPLVHVEIDTDGRVSVDGRVEPHARLVDRRSLADLAVLAVARDHAHPLGRGVRVVARTPTEHSSMVVHPDGEVTDLAPYPPPSPAPPQPVTRQKVRARQPAPHRATPDGVAPATRARHWLDAREDDRVRAEEQAARGATRGPGRRVLVGVGSVVAAMSLLAAAVAVGWPGGDGAPTARAGSDRLSDAAADVPAEVDAAGPVPLSVLPAPRLTTLAVTDVGADTTPGVLRLAVETSRRTPVKVVLTATDSEAVARRLSLSVRAATTRQVEVADLAPGRYRWVLRAPGQRRLTGLVDVPAVAAPPPVEVVPVAQTPVSPVAPVLPPPVDDGVDDGGQAPSPPPAPPPTRAPDPPRASDVPGSGPGDPTSGPVVPCDPDDGC